MHKHDTILRIMAGLALSVVPFGCTIEKDDGGYIRIAGRVTYEGQPVKKGTIHFLPMQEGRVAASGEIDKGVIKNVTTHTQGDGIMEGRYKVTIVAFEESGSEQRADRFNGPTASEVASLVTNTKVVIPLKYSSVAASDLTAYVSRDNRTFDFVLKD